VNKNKKEKQTNKQTNEEKEEKEYINLPINHASKTCKYLNRCH
jgi:hypothetical protein